MKAVLSFLILLWGVSAGFTQGRVFFVNTGTFLTPADRNVYVLDGSGAVKLTGTNYAAALYFGMTSDNINQLAVRSEEDQTLLSAIGRFRAVDPGSFSAGTWSGATRILPGTTVGQPVYLEVRVWDINLFPTFEEASAAGSPHGVSQAFLYNIPSPLDAPSLKMDGFRAFAFSVPGPSAVPEPSVFVLAAIGVGALFVLRRKARC